MADEADMARRASQVTTDAAITTIRRKAAQPVAEATGWCLYCGECVPEGRRWCDAQCCAAWELEQ